jgi:hypothetical protein
MTDVLYNTPLPVPLSRSLNVEFAPGKSINIKGRMKGDRCNINLVQQAGQDHDIALHTSIRMDEHQFVFNSCQKGVWGKEETHKTPFKQGEEFELRLRALSTGYEIFCNGKELCTFPHRAPLNTIRFVEVTGAVELMRVALEGGFYPMPFDQPISNFEPNKVIRVTGQAEKKANHFNINLRHGNDVVFHISVRFNEKKVVRNTLQGGKWGKEEDDHPLATKGSKEPTFPFHQDQIFDIVIQSTNNAFQVYVDGKKYCEFHQRLPSNSIDHLQIEGDIELQGVFF